MSEQQVAEQLKKLIAEYGKQLVVDEPRRTAALLLDFCAQHKREARVLIAVVEEGLTAELVRDAGKTSAAILLLRQAKCLHDELGIDEKLALWAVRAWAEALGWSLPALKVVATAAKHAAATKPPTSTPTKAPAQQKTLPLIGGRYLDNGDGTVTDTQTGLQWMRCSLGQEWDGKTCIGTAKGFKWQKALDAADELNQKGGYAGHQDWRVPTIGELESLVLDANKPTIDLDAFPDTQDDWFWSSSPYSPYAGNAYRAWYVGFGNGHVISNGKYNVNRVRLVRTGQ